ncbi:hypothetical protein [Gordonia alkanivorans]|uniref:hypothetical protein n=1 Tax=Gordonia alkanivorans TaxID=84096 RepID=UPI002449794B|nr:hypothetical protein [Gordonia alkanivorans]MDH3021152.1 hypothetical protein [Gordonia alkanivorans]MDJ0010396.1 hypothetical protein [Gordonia alkanivorans]MDJ0099912.1 hypothetical protein [Gordonia alkanivorans]MDJ0496026.1 hypothetical protein [Gordonia alkanivorans]
MTALPVLIVDDIKAFVDDDVLSDSTIQSMINTAAARAVKVAPCLRIPLSSTDPVSPLADEVSAEIVKDVMRSAVLRWIDRGSGAVYSETSGDFQRSLLKDSASLFRPNEIRDLEEVCRDYRRRQTASTVLTFAPNAYQVPSVHPFVTDTDGPLY